MTLWRSLSFLVPKSRRSVSNEEDKGTIHRKSTSTTSTRTTTTTSSVSSQLLRLPSNTSSTGSVFGYSQPATPSPAGTYPDGVQHFWADVHLLVDAPHSAPIPHMLRRSHTDEGARCRYAIILLLYIWLYKWYRIWSHSAAAEMIHAATWVPFLCAYTPLTPLFTQC